MYQDFSLITPPPFFLSDADNPKFLTSGSFAAVATLDIVLTAYTAYRALMFLLSEVIPATDGDGLRCRFSTNGGSSYDQGATDYSWSVVGSAAVNSTGDTSVAIASTTNAIGGAATDGIEALVLLPSQTNTARWNQVFGASSFVSNAATPNNVASSFSGARRAAQDTDAIRFFMSLGNMSGKYAVYGYQ